MGARAKGAKSKSRGQRIADRFCKIRAYSSSSATRRRVTSRANFALITMRADTDILALLLIATGGFVAATPAQNIPSFLKICHRRDPRLNECIKRSVDSLRPYLKTGIPALQIPSCEPLRVQQVEINQAAGPVSVKSTYSDIDIHGTTDFVLKSVKIDLDKDRVRLKLYIPYLEMIAKYNINGRIMMLPIAGDGTASGNFTHIDVVATMQGERYQSQKTGELHYRVTDLYVDFDIGHANIHLDNLFNGDKNLSGAMNLFLNDNWKIVAAEMKPVFEGTISELFKTFSNKIYSKFPLDTLLPP